MGAGIQMEEPCRIWNPTRLSLYHSNHSAHTMCPLKQYTDHLNVLTNSQNDTRVPSNNCIFFMQEENHKKETMHHHNELSNTSLNLTFLNNQGRATSQIAEFALLKQIFYWNVIHNLAYECDNLTSVQIYRKNILSRCNQEANTRQAKKYPQYWNIFITLLATLLWPGHTVGQRQTEACCECGSLRVHCTSERSVKTVAPVKICM
jgi:hypothetical protein